jgi:PAS domain S-box-containing protein
MLVGDEEAAMKPTKQPSTAETSAPHGSEIPAGWTADDLQRVLDGMPAGVCVCDPDGLITYFNRRAVEIWGRAPEPCDPEDRFCGPSSLFERDGTPIVADDSWMALALRDGGRAVAREVVVERPDGSRLAVLAHAAPLRDAEGRLVGAVNILVDITERTQGEDALRQADRAKDSFLATLAHELRNPLAPVRHAMQILERQGSSGPEGGWALGVIGRQVRQMSRLIDGLVDLSSIPEDRLVLYRQPVELTELVRSALEMAQSDVEDKSQRVTVEVPGETIWLDADPVRLSQALANLLDNAVRFTRPGGRIELTARREDGNVTLTVTDEGKGIPPDVLEHIFEPFTQVEEAPGGVRPSRLGIGLPLAKEIVERHGGEVEVESAGEGRGSRFTIRLPIAEEVIRPAATLPATGLRVLVADDNRDAAEGLARLLELEGHECHTAYDGLHALELAEQVRPRVAVLDIGMPGLDGYEVAQRIRSLPDGDEILLVALTGWGQEEDRRRAEQAGFDHHLVKPVSAEALLELLPAAERPS